MQKRVLSLLGDNTAGVTTRVSGLFSRRGYNIDSLTVGETENPVYSRMTVVASGDDEILEQIRKQLQKQVDELTQRLSDYQSGNPTDLDGVQAVYDNLIQAMQYYINDDKLSAAKALDKVDPDSLAGDEAKKFYKKIKNATYSPA